MQFNLGDQVLNQFTISNFIFKKSMDGSSAIFEFNLKRNPAFLMMNAYLPSFLTMIMTIASLFLDDRMHFSTTIMLVLTSQLCLYTLFQSSLEGIPRTAYMKFIDYWNMFAMTISLTNFFTLFLWEILSFREVKSHLKSMTRLVIPLISVLGALSYWIIAGLMVYGYIN